ncbi:hypothetical protein F5Y19DRAFT_481629 [Xylariaceae sp. FL1651]|nr:hypothetical protein F5Y19DRAFT_481629 [Xylariaceae sp. FL1651]
MNKCRPSVKTRVLFHETALSYPSDGPALMKACARLFQVAKTSRPTETHRFDQVLRASDRLVRDYMQNIDCLEETVGLDIDLRRGPGAGFVRSSEAIPWMPGSRGRMCAIARASSLVTVLELQTAMPLG